MSDTLAATVDAIADLLYARDLPGAKKLFDDAVHGDQTVVEPLVRQLAATTIVPSGVLVWGFGLDIWANPYRDPDERAWRCGDCPWTASHYKSDRAAQASAEQHVAEHHASRPPKVLWYCDDAYWQAVEAAEEGATR